MMTDDGDKPGRLEMALGGLSLLKELDKAIVPLNPSPYMIKIGAAAGGVEKETAKIIYETMVAVSVFAFSEDDLGNRY